MYPLLPRLGYPFVHTLVGLLPLDAVVVTPYGCRWLFEPCVAVTLRTLPGYVVVIYDYLVTLDWRCWFDYVDWLIVTVAIVDWLLLLVTLQLGPRTHHYTVTHYSCLQVGLYVELDLGYPDSLDVAHGYPFTVTLRCLTLDCPSIWNTRYALVDYPLIWLLIARVAVAGCCYGWLDLFCRLRLDVTVTGLRCCRYVTFTRIYPLRWLRALPVVIIDLIVDLIYLDCCYVDLIWLDGYSWLIYCSYLLPVARWAGSVPQLLWLLLIVVGPVCWLIAVDCWLFVGWFGTHWLLVTFDCDSITWLEIVGVVDCSYGDCSYLPPCPGPLLRLDTDLLVGLRLPVTVVAVGYIAPCYDLIAVLLLLRLLLVDCWLLLRWLRLQLPLRCNIVGCSYLAVIWLGCPLYICCYGYTVHCGWLIWLRFRYLWLLRDYDCRWLRWVGLIGYPGCPVVGWLPCWIAPCLGWFTVTVTVALDSPVLDSFIVALLLRLVDLLIAVALVTPDVTFGFWTLIAQLVIALLGIAVGYLWFCCPCTDCLDCGLLTVSDPLPIALVPTVALDYLDCTLPSCCCWLPSLLPLPWLIAPCPFVTLIAPCLGLIAVDHTHLPLDPLSCWPWLDLAWLLIWLTQFLVTLALLLWIIVVVFTFLQCLACGLDYIVRQDLALPVVPCLVPLVGYDVVPCLVPHLVPCSCWIVGSCCLLPLFLFIYSVVLVHCVGSHTPCACLWLDLCCIVVHAFPYPYLALCPLCPVPLDPCLVAKDPPEPDAQAWRLLLYLCALDRCALWALIAPCALLIVIVDDLTLIGPLLWTLIYCLVDLGCAPPCLAH